VDLLMARLQRSLGLNYKRVVMLTSEMAASVGWKQLQSDPSFYYSYI
jgi:hypothetical protein